MLHLIALSLLRGKGFLLKQRSQVLSLSMTTESETTSLQFLEIEQRCKEANIEVKLSKTEDNTDKLTVLLQAGKVKRKILVRNEQSAKALLSLPFEKIRGISSYRAFWSPEDGFIEAILDSGRLTSLPPFLTLRRLQKAFQSSTTIIEEPQEIEDDSQTEIDSADSRITINSDDERFQGTRLSIGLATQTISVLETLRLRGRLRLGERDRLSRPMTIRIEGVSLSFHDQAVNILEKIANSFLFQVDLLIGLPMYLAIEEDREIRVRRASAGREETRLTFPKYQYDSKAMSLYWYASTARGIPLLQYLAYYQVIEFYFPIFAEKEAHEQIKRL